MANRSPCEKPITCQFLVVSLVNATLPTPSGKINICGLKVSFHCKCSWRLNVPLITVVYVSGCIGFAWVCSHREMSFCPPAGPIHHSHSSPREGASLSQKTCTMSNCWCPWVETLQLELLRAEMLHQNPFLPIKATAAHRGWRGSAVLLSFWGTGRRPGTRPGI